MSTSPCPYFALKVGTIPLAGHFHPVRVPVCRCGLTEPLVARLRSHPDGTPLVALLEASPLDGQPRPVVAADLQPVSPIACTNERKQASCLPNFVALLHDFGLDTTIPPEP